MTRLKSGKMELGIQEYKDFEFCREHECIELTEREGVVFCGSEYGCYYRVTYFLEWLKENNYKITKAS